MSVNVPSVEDEAKRHLHRELEDWIDQRRQHTNRIKSLLATMGLAAEVNQDFLEQLKQLRMWNGQALPEGTPGPLATSIQGWQFADCQVKDLENQRKQAIRSGTDPSMELVRQLLQFKGIGLASAWLFVREVFAWRQIKTHGRWGRWPG